MSDDDQFATRRNVIRAAAGAGVAGVAAQPVAASDGRDAKLGPLADAPKTQKLSFREYQEVLAGDDNGRVELVSGRVKRQDVLVGDDPDATVSAMERRFADGVTGDTTWEKCLDTPWYVPDGCVELTVEVTDAGVEITLVALGYVLVDAVLPKEGSATYDFDVPLFSITGTLSVSSELVDTCTVELSGSLSATVYGEQFGPYSETVTESFCY
jgi:hypothetical protein